VQILFDPHLLILLLGTLLVYWGVLRQTSFRLAFLGAVSFALVFSLHPWFALTAEGVVTGIWFVHRQPSSRTLVGSILVAVILIGIGKYGKDIALAFYPWADWVTTALVMPLGVSYFAFRLIQVASDSYRGVLGEQSWIQLNAFFFFFPILPAGPLETYQGFFEKRSNAFDAQLFQEGIRKACLGYVKKLIVVDLVLRDAAGPLFNHFILGAGDLSALGPWAPWKFLVLSFLRAYFDLSAYSDIAIGLSALFGFRILQNFNVPFLKSNVAAFWRSWHVSLSTWCRDQVYFPLFGWLRRPWIAVYASMGVMGLWHAVSWNWLVWSGYHGTGLVVYSAWDRRKRRHPTLQALCSTGWARGLGIGITFWFVALGYAFVAAPNFSRAWEIWVACARSLGMFFAFQAG
jgi:alginate O-acetyltransferase complex protein AlgI